MINGHQINYLMIIKHKILNKLKELKLMEDQLEWERSLKSATGHQNDEAGLEALKASLKQLQDKVTYQI
jgi:hypothetical protein